MSVLHFTEDEFISEVENGTGTALVDFWAPWCGPCRMLGPIIEELADELDSDDIIIGKVDVDENPSLAEKYDVNTIPTVIIFKDGVEVNRSIGFIPKEKLLDLIK